MFSHRLRPALFCLALALPAQPALAQDQARPGFFDIFNFETLTTSLMNTVMTAARTFADIRYQQVSFDPVAARLTLLDLDIRPHLPGFAPDACTVTAARATIGGQPLDRPHLSRFRISLDDVNVGLGCLPPEARGAVFGVGLEAISLSRADLTIRYDYASGGGTAELLADLDGVAAIEAFVDADYISFRLDPATEEPRLALDLNIAHLTVDDRGGWDLAKRVIPQGMQDPAALQQIVSGAVAEVITDANGVSTPQLSADQQRLVAEAGAVARGIAEGHRRLVLSTSIKTPPFRIDETSTAAFQPFFDALAPVVSGSAPQLSQAIPVAVLEEALNSETLPPNAMELGRAMLTGVGTPRNVSNGLKLLARASRKDDAEAAYLVAEALMERDPETAYGHALRAAANKVPGALAILDMAERGTSYETMIQLQNDATPSGPVPSLYASVLDMRRAARDYMNGTGSYRSYRAAYYWASMAAAAGDASGAAMRDEIEELMRLRGDADAWAEEITSLENGVLRDWIKRDLPSSLK